MIPFDAVLFDMDGVLVDSESVTNRVWVELLGEHGLHFTHEAFMAYSVGTSLRSLYAKLQRDHAWQRPETFSVTLDARLREAFRGVPQVPGADDTLRALTHARIPFAIASNSRADRLSFKLAEARLETLVGVHTYHPQDVGGRGKPLPDLYLHAAQQLGVRITRCLVVEDSATGVAAGVAAGATVWGFLGASHRPNGEALRAAGAVRVLPGHAALREALSLADAAAVACEL